MNTSLNSVTCTASELLDLLENDYPLRRELEAFFLERWEAVSGVAEWRASFDKDLLADQERSEGLMNKIYILKDAADELLQAIEANRPKRGNPDIWDDINAKANALKELTK